MKKPSRKKGCMVTFAVFVACLPVVVSTEGRTFIGPSDSGHQLTVAAGEMILIRHSFGDGSISVALGSPGNPEIGDLRAAAGPLEVVLDDKRMVQYDLILVSGAETVLLEGESEHLITLNAGQTITFYDLPPNRAQVSDGFTVYTIDEPSSLFGATGLIVLDGPLLIALSGPHEGEDIATYSINQDASAQALGHVVAVPEGGFRLTVEHSTNLEHWEPVWSTAITAAENGSYRVSVEKP